MGKSDIEILKKIESTKPDFTGVNLSANALDFIQKCLTDNPEKRISWREIYDHPLIKSQEKMVYGAVSRLKV
jgi:serine/threonine protein kinase